MAALVDFGGVLKSLWKAVSMAVGIVAVLAALSVGFNLMNRPNTVELAGGFVLVVLAVWAAIKGARLWIEW